MHTDMIRRNKVKITGMIAATCLAGLCLVACDREESFGEKPEKPGSTELRFAAALEGSLSTKTIGKPDILGGSDFPMNDTYTFGMFITDEAGNGLPDGTQSNMKTTLTRGAAAGEDTWTHTTSGDTEISPKAEPAQSVNIYGYYPWVAGATATAVPFNLTGSMDGKKELLYISSPTSPITMPADGNIALTFSHAYCWVKVKLTKLSDKNNVEVKSVSIDNLHGNLNWIKNQGTISPKTGEVNSSGFTPGPLTVNCALAEDVPLDGSGTTLPLEFDFLIPSFLGRIKDGEVVIRITTGADGTTANDKVLTFPLAKNNLNGDDDLSSDDICGFRKGWKNEYSIIYNNAAMILELSDWQSYPINGSLGGQVGGTPQTANYVAGSSGNAQDYYSGIRPFGVTNIGDSPNPDNHLFHTYLGEEVNGNNGSYVEVEIDLNASFVSEWKKTGSRERINPQLMVARTWGAGGAPVPWKDPTTGVLSARQACASLRDGGYKDWRLPRINELYVINQRIKLENTREYWSGTEYNADNAWVITKGTTVSWLLPYPRAKTIPLYVRCVRDATKPK